MTTAQIYKKLAAHFTPSQIEKDPELMKLFRYLLNNRNKEITNQAICDIIYRHMGILIPDPGIKHYDNSLLKQMAVLR